MIIIGQCAIHINVNCFNDILQMFSIFISIYYLYFSLSKTVYIIAKLKFLQETFLLGTRYTLKLELLYPFSGVVNGKGFR